VAKYVMLQFDSDEDADAFIKTTQENGIVGSFALGDSNWKHFMPIVRAVFKKPTQFCDCKVGAKGRGFTRGKRYGWWVCSVCKKPTVGWGRGEHWFLSLGRNLLPTTPQAPEYRGDGVFGNHFKPCDTCGTRLATKTGHATAEVWCPSCGVWK